MNGPTEPKRTRSLQMKGKLLLTFAVILLLPSLLIAGVSFYSAKQEIEDQLLQRADEQVKTLAGTIDAYLDLQMKEVERVASHLAGQGLTSNDSAAHAYLQEAATIHNEWEGIYIGTETGAFVSTVSVKAGYDPRTRPWYQQAMENKGKTVITDPYISASTDLPVITIARTTKDGHGVVGLDLSLQALAEITSRVKIGEFGYVVLMDKQRKFIVHPQQKAGTEAEKADYIDHVYANEAGTFEFVNQDGQSKRMAFVTNGLTGWKLLGTNYVSEAEAEASDVLPPILTIVAVAVIGGAVLVLWIVRLITRPLAVLMAAAAKISEGDLSEPVRVNARDEIGRLAESFEGMRLSLQSVLAEVNQGAVQVAASAEELMASADQSSKASEQISSAIQEVAVGADKQVAGVEEAYQVVNMMASAAEQINGNTQQVAGLASEASDKAASGSQTVQTAINQMTEMSVTVKELAHTVDGLGKRSQEIGSIVDVISEIADQTNLLALNAAIEAARAGEHGRGFAVVADEVRKLAEQTTQSTQKIAELIAVIRQETNDAVRSMHTVTQEVAAGIDVVHAAGASFEEIRAAVEELAGQIQEVSGAVQQLTEGTKRVVETTHTIREVAEEAAFGTQNVSAAAQQQLASMEEINASATALAKMAEDLQEMVGSFKV
ncbi:methyl-accepting chemotaxis protein [Brevibacillus sp. MCWH]|uniref:methyl-accepting chemotaxis protein n=1 Tax=Brevibacillus sp. MCWH TaxID=2508871 RepID=UPI001490B6DE|nr:methyl-accepting chemotaxis protein [Brevibacillus sp. MCWH]NNV03032.1 methyl-accepting chemotaxis protein [Brevibacillus sp. MCWH]